MIQVNTKTGNTRVVRENGPRCVISVLEPGVVNVSHSLSLIHLRRQRGQQRPVWRPHAAVDAEQRGAELHDALRLG